MVEFKWTVRKLNGRWYAIEPGGDRMWPHWTWRHAWDSAALAADFMAHWKGKGLT